MTWFSVKISPINSPEGETINRKSKWIEFIMLMNFVSCFLHVCYLEKFGNNGTWWRTNNNENEANDAGNIPLKGELVSIIHKVDWYVTNGRIFHPLTFIIFNYFYSEVIQPMPLAASRWESIAMVLFVTVTMERPPGVAMFVVVFINMKKALTSIN